MVIILIGFVGILIAPIVYLCTGVGKCFFHDVLEWHQPNETVTYQGIIVSSVCKHCGKEIMRDSQGNWF